MTANEVAAVPALLERVEHLYAAAKGGMWADIWRALAGERELAAACSRYVKLTSGWTFLHQAAHAGDEAAVRVLLRLGASLSVQSKEGDTAQAVAVKCGHAALAALMGDAETGAADLWEPSPEPDLLPSSGAWASHSARRAWRELRIGYGRGCVVIHPRRRSVLRGFVRARPRWVARNVRPPSGMDTESML